MIRGSIALNTHQIASRVAWVHYRHIDKEASNTDLGHTLKSFVTQPCYNRDFKITVRGSPCLSFCCMENTSLAKAEKITEGLYTAFGCRTGNNVLRSHGTENMPDFSDSTFQRVLVRTSG